VVIAGTLVSLKVQSSGRSILVESAPGDNSLKVSFKKPLILKENQTLIIQIAFGVNRIKTKLN